MAADFFGKFAEAIDHLGVEEAEPAAEAEAPPPAAEAPAGGLPTGVWVAGVIAIVAALLFFFATRGN